MKKSVVIAALLLVSGIAGARGLSTPNFYDPTRGDGIVQAPEIDPSSALSALTLLAGGLVVLRGRFSKK
jgi:uncharacterized protein YdeI (BOF family)